MSSHEQGVVRQGGKAGSGGAIESVITPTARDLGGFSVRRVLPGAALKKVGPWVFFDHLGPAHFPVGEGINVRPHPHLNLATVTYLFEGEILHRDSLGSVQAITPGDINLMVAGRGVVHSERQRPEITCTAHDVHGIQLWLGLPDEQEQIDPAFYHYRNADIPTVMVHGVPVRVMMGSAYGVSSPVKTFAETVYVEAQLKAGQEIVPPAAEERAVYVASGALAGGETSVPEHTLAVLGKRGESALKATEDSRIVIIGGEKLGTRYLEWNFVSSRRERIEKAKEDWKAGRFPKIPGDDQEFIPLPEE